MLATSYTAADPAASAAAFSIFCSKTWLWLILRKQKHASLNNNESNVAVDEVKQYMDGRKIGS
jgi:hypothetical protein